MTEAKETSYPNISQSWGIVGIAVLCMLAFAPVLLLSHTIGTELSSLIYYVASMGATFWIAHRKRCKTAETAYNFEAAPLKTIALVSVATIAIQTGIVSPIVDLIPMPESIQHIFLEMAKRNGVFSFIAIVIAAPMLEELIFRGVILDGLLKLYSPLKSILFSSVLFGLLHLNPWQFVGAFVAGLLLGWVYYRTKKLILCITIHLVNNLFAFGSTYFTDPETMMDKSLSELYGGFLNFIMITVGAIALAAVCLHLLDRNWNHHQGKLDWNYRQEHTNSDISD